jgi:hypothetical protein
MSLENERGCDEIMMQFMQSQDDSFEANESFITDNSNLINVNPTTFN